MPVLGQPKKNSFRTTPLSVLKVYDTLPENLTHQPSRTYCRKMGHQGWHFTASDNAPWGPYPILCFPTTSPICGHIHITHSTPSISSHDSITSANCLIYAHLMRRIMPLIASSLDKLLISLNLSKRVRIDGLIVLSKHVLRPVSLPQVC